MFKRVSIKLMVSNIMVFIAVLFVFSFAVYFPAVRNANIEVERRAQILCDTVAGSFEEEEANEEPVPEILEADNRDPIPQSTRVQWFSADGKLLAEKGGLESLRNKPLHLGLETFQSPDAIAFTRTVSRNKHLLGTLRAAISTDSVDEYSQKLIRHLLVGSAIALLAAGLGSLWLVRESLQPVEKSFGTLLQFTADAAHELRNPLTAIKANSAVALRYPDNMRETDREKFLMIGDATDQLIKITSDLLWLARADEGVQRKQRISLEVDAALHKLTAKLQPLADLKSIQIDCSQIVAARIETSEEDFRTIFENLVSNAIQYTGANGTIEILAYIHRKHLTVIVQDTGIGIAAADLPKIFDRFWRSDKARSHRSGGNGLGLAIVKSTVERLGGNVSVQSEVGQGTKFTVNLPC